MLYLIALATDLTSDAEEKNTENIVIESTEESVEPTEETLEHIVLNTEVETETIEEAPEPEYISFNVPSNNSFKSYMSYTAITKKSSPQYKLQQIAHTGEYGIRMVEDRYCVALGTHFSKTIGTKIDVVMANGNVLKCILGDVKSPQHTDAQNIRAQDGSILEFVIDRKALHQEAKRRGNVSYADEKFAGEITEIRVYK